jgi:hypothetical protein
MLVNEVIVEKAVAGDICTFKLPLESVYQIDCIKSKALFFIIKFLKACFNTLKQAFFIKHLILVICYFCTILLKNVIFTH